MNTDLKDLKPLIFKGLNWLKRYGLVIGILIIAGLYAYLVIQINLLNKKEPTIDQINERLDKIPQPSISEENVQKLKQLEENSDEVKTLFKDARDNPFKE